MTNYDWQGEYGHDEPDPEPEPLLTGHKWPRPFDYDTPEPDPEPEPEPIVIDRPVLVNLSWPADIVVDDLTDSGTDAAKPVAVDDSTGANVTAKALELAEEHGLDLADVRGSGAGGRILVKDVQALIGG